MRLMKIICILVLCALFVGCASTGNQVLGQMTSQQIKQKIHKGMSMNQVKDLFGDPTSVDITDTGKTIWKYEYQKIHATGEDFIPVYSMLHRTYKGNKKQLVLVFVKNRLINYQQTNAAITTTTGLW